MVDTPLCVPPAVQAVEPLLIPRKSVAALIGCSEDHVDRLRAAGKMPAPLKLGRKILWRADELRAWVSASCPDLETWSAMQAQTARRFRVV